MIEKKYIIGIIITIGIFLVIASFTGILFGQKSDVKQSIIEEKKMELEFRTLSTLPGASEVKHSSYHKEGLASIYSSYFTSKTYDEIHSYFLEEAPKNGWTFVEEKPFTEDWGKDFGGKKISFKKNQYLLSIIYRGEKANDNVTFDVSIRWSIW